MRKMIITMGLIWGLVQVVWGQADLPVFRSAGEVQEITPTAFAEEAGGCSWYCGAPPITLSASTCLKDEGKNSYQAQMAHDFKLETAWVEGKDDQGVGETLTFRFDMSEDPNEKLTITGLKLANGYQKSHTAWENNGRVKRLKMTVDGRDHGTLELQDGFGVQEIGFGEVPLPTKKVTEICFTILEAYPGKKFNDTAISEIEFVGTGVH